MSALYTTYTSSNVSQLTSTISSTNTTTDKHRSELDSHADTCCFGRHAAIVGHYDQTVRVTPFHPDLAGMSDIPIVNAAVAYDDPTTGRTKILQFNQVLHFSTMEHNLICNMQLRCNDIDIDECPKFLSSHPTDTTHTISVPLAETRIPLFLHGTTQYFTTRTPTDRELVTCETIDMTYEYPDWDPHSSTFAEEEENMMDSQCQVRHPPNRDRDRDIFGATTRFAKPTDRPAPHSHVAAIRVAQHNSQIYPR